MDQESYTLTLKLCLLWIRIGFQGFSMSLKVMVNMNNYATPFEPFDARKECKCQYEQRNRLKQCKTTMQKMRLVALAKICEKCTRYTANEIIKFLFGLLTLLIKLKSMIIHNSILFYRNDRDDLNPPNVQSSGTRDQNA